MPDLPKKAATHLQEACIHLDNARYAISCGIVECGLHHATAHAAAAINLTLSDALRHLQQITPAKSA
jgi:hypothetical protein